MISSGITRQEIVDAGNFYYFGTNKAYDEVLQCPIETIDKLTDKYNFNIRKTMEKGLNIIEHLKGKIK